jgi:hypothetical protein
MANEADLYAIRLSAQEMDEVHIQVKGSVHGNEHETERTYPGVFYFNSLPQLDLMTRGMLLYLLLDSRNIK